MADQSGGDRKKIRTDQRCDSACHRFETSLGAGSAGKSGTAAQHPNGSALQPTLSNGNHQGVNPQRANQPLSTLYRQFDQKLDFCQSCLTITHQLLESLETDDGDLVLQLLKRRDTVFHRIRRLDNEISSSPVDDDRIRQASRISSQLKSLLDQIEQKIHQMMQLDVQIHQKIRENRVQARNQIGQAQTQQKIARAYRIAGAKPASLLDLNE